MTFQGEHHTLTEQSRRYHVCPGEVCYIKAATTKLMSRDMSLIQITSSSPLVGRHRHDLITLRQKET